MKAKTTFLLLLTLLIVLSVGTFRSFAQHTAYTQLSLPAGAKARLGKGSVEEIRYSPDSSLLAVGSNIGIWLYDTKTYRELALLAGQMDWVYSLSFSPDGKTIASGGWSYDDTVRLWDVATGNLKSTLTGDGFSVSDRPKSKDLGFRKLCESICGMQKRTGRFNGVAYDLAKQDNRSYLS